MIIHFSCGATSAIAGAIALKSNPDAEIIYADTGAEHPDNWRFLADCERVLFKKKVTVLKHPDYKDLYDLLIKDNVMSFQKGAPCTLKLKKEVIRDYLGERLLTDKHVYGFDTGELPRIELYKNNNPEIQIILPLIDHGLSKANCLALLQRFGIDIPEMYKLGYEHSNCIGCVKARDSVGYWEGIRQDFPDIFSWMAKHERRVGAIDEQTGKPKGFCLNRRTRKGVREKVWLDKWPDDIKPKRELEISCGYSCGNVSAIIEDRIIVKDREIDSVFGWMNA